MTGTTCWRSARSTQTLILDEDGLYDPATFNDRLLLGLKGTMSEAELYVLRARLHGGILNKAKRGALKLHLPIGFRYSETDDVILDPHQQVRDTITFLFQYLSRNEVSQRHGSHLSPTAGCLSSPCPEWAAPGRIGLVRPTP